MPNRFGLGQIAPGVSSMFGAAPYPKTFGASRIDHASLDQIDPGAGLSRSTSTPGTILNKANTGAAFQGLLNQVTRNPAAFTPGYNPEMPTEGHSQQANDLIQTLSTGRLRGADKTGMVSVGPNGFDIQSANGWSAGLGTGGLTFDSGKGFGGRINPQGAAINVGPIGVQGTWAGDKSIRADINLGRDKMSQMNMGMPKFMSQFMAPNQGLPGAINSIPQSEARKLMEQQTEEYAARNPYYRYR